MASPQRIINRPRRVGDSDDHSAPSNAAVAAATASPTVSCDPKANRPHSAPVVGLWEGKLAPPECVSRPAIQYPYDIVLCIRHAASFTKINTTNVTITSVSIQCGGFYRWCRQRAGSVQRRLQQPPGRNSVQPGCLSIG